MTIEPITWRPANKPPEHQRTVLLAVRSEEGRTAQVVAGFRERRRWLDVTAWPIPGGYSVTHWAELPRGPA